MSKKSAVVIGAGIAGLTAAYELQKEGFDVLVLEQNSYIGGRMFTVDWNGFRVDGGAKFVTTSDKSLLRIVKEIGLESELIKSQDGLTITIFRDHKLHSANFLSIPSYFGWQGVSLKARFAMLKLIPHILKMGKINPYHMESVSMEDVNKTFEVFFKSQISEEMFEYWAIPMFETMCAYKGDDVSQKAFLAMMAGYLNSDSLVFKQGIGTMPEKLASYLDVKLNATVNSIRSYADFSGAQISYFHDGKQSLVDADVVVVAVPGNQVLKLLRSKRPAWDRFFSQVAYSTGALHYHLVKTDFTPPVKGTFVPRILGLPVNNIAFEQYKDGHWLILTDPSVYTFDVNQDENDLVANAVSSIKHVFPDFKGDFVDHKIFRWQNKLPTFRPGYLDSLAKFWSNPQEGPIYFCGDYFAGPSTGAALYTGLECVNRILNS